MSQPGFFDFRAKRVGGARRKPGGDNPPASRVGGPDPITVTELTRRIEQALRQGIPGSITVRGEVSNFSHHRSSGHLYFTLKDTGACVDCVMFRSDAARLRFEPADGMELLATGGVRVYAQRGRYQLYVTSLAPLGQGALELALARLREKLAREGLFAPQRKKPIPRFPRTVAIVTGRQTAALQDIVKVLHRLAFLRLLLVPVPVQGEGAGARIAEAIETLSRSARTLGVDVLLLARGGGSLEDLWAFNEEAVARAIAGCSIPVITGIGHEIDVSIADLVADHHAHTPTEAAQVVASHWKTAPDDLANLSRRLRLHLVQALAAQKQRLLALARHELFRRPGDLVETRRQWLDDRQRSLVEALARQASLARARLTRVEALLQRNHPEHGLRLARGRLDAAGCRLLASAARVTRSRADRLNALERELRAVSPSATLERGYTITTDRKTGRIIRSSTEPGLGEAIVTRFLDGQVESVVRDQKQMRLFE